MKTFPFVIILLAVALGTWWLISPWVLIAPIAFGVGYGTARITHPTRRQIER